MQRFTWALVLALSACTFDTQGPSILLGDGAATPDGSTTVDALVFVDASDSATQDGPASDGPASDGPAHESMAHEASTSDSTVDMITPDGTVDAITPDGTVDTLTPDGTVDTLTPDSTWDTTSIQSCDEIFGTGSRYTYCAETPTTCTYYVDLQENSCDDFCDNHGTSCLGSFNEGPDHALCAFTGTDRLCHTDANDRVCICHKP